MAVGDKGSKRKAKRDPDESDDDEEFEEKPQIKQDDSDDGSEAETKPKKKAKKAEPADEDEGEGGARRGESSNTQYDDDGRPYFLVSVGPRKRITLSEFKGKEYINIREYYTDKADGKDKPGKKGITLDLDQWTLLKSKTSLIDSWISDSSSKPPKAKAARGKK